jgi:hypothetical protein
MAYGVLGLWAFTNLEIAYALAARRRTPAHLPHRQREQRPAYGCGDRDARGRLRRRGARLRPGETTQPPPPC